MTEKNSVAYNCDVGLLKDGDECLVLVS